MATIAFAPAAYSPAIGGTETYTKGLAEGLVRLGHDVHVVVADVTSSQAFYEPGYSPTGHPDETINGVIVHRVRLLTGKAAALGSRVYNPARNLRRFRRGFVRMLRDLRPEVVITLPHLFPNVEEVLGLRSRNSWRVVYAPVLHESDPWWPREKVKEAVAVADAVIALTEHERTRLLADYGATPETTAVVPPGVEILTPDSADRDRDQVVLFLGRQSASKSIETLLDAMTLVWIAHPEARLVLAGPLSVSSQDRWSYPVDPRVEVRGEVSAIERSDLMSAARVVATASQIEAFGITTLEAWAHATPVIVTDTPASRELVRDGVDGLIVEPSAESLAAAIGTLLADPRRAADLGREGRARAARDFSWAGTTSRLAKLLESL